jgi:hypothetical protein
MNVKNAVMNNFVAFMALVNAFGRAFGRRIQICTAPVLDTFHGA